MPTNQWGPYTFPPPSGPFTVPPTGALAPPQSPSGSVTGESATSNYASGDTSTETFLSIFGENEPQQGALALNAPVVCTGGVSAAAQSSVRWE